MERSSDEYSTINTTGSHPVTPVDDHSYSTVQTDSAGGLENRRWSIDTEGFCGEKKEKFRAISGYFTTAESYNNKLQLNDDTLEKTEFSVKRSLRIASLLHQRNLV